MSATCDPSGNKPATLVSPGSASNPAIRKASPQGTRCRQISGDDVDAITDLLNEGFPRLPRQHWVAALEVLGTRAIPEGVPRYGFMLESDGRAVGVLLVIVSQVLQGETTKMRTNGSAWYVQPNFRTHANVLLDRSMRLPSETYLNIFPAPHTFAFIEARGFIRYSNGTAVAVPALSRWVGGTRIIDAARLATAGRPISDHDRDLLIDHSRAGCVAFWCETRDGGYPFVFRRRLLKSCLPSAQLIYCRDLDDLTRLAGPVGRYLLFKGLPLILASTNGPIPGMPGKYFDGMYPMYFRGGNPPRTGDLAYTEAGLFGF
jgi:hypothetical protein